MNSLLPLALFALVSSITPGPNNLMLTSSGMLFGFNRSIPHMLGVSAGFALMLALCALGIGSLILALPLLHLALKLAGSGYLLLLAWRLRTLAFNQTVNPKRQPMSFMAAALFQFANPKAWFMAITGAAAFLPTLQPLWLAVACFCIVFCAINLPCIGLWTIAGAGLRRYLDRPLWRIGFCVTTIGLTLYAAAAIWFGA